MPRHTLHSLTSGYASLQLQEVADLTGNLLNMASLAGEGGVDSIDVGSLLSAAGAVGAALNDLVGDDVADDGATQGDSAAPSGGDGKEEADSNTESTSEVEQLRKQLQQMVRKACVVRRSPLICCHRRRVVCWTPRNATLISPKNLPTHSSSAKSATPGKHCVAP